ncbi:cytosolic phospholipase A2 beta [Monodelphis domestica]|uniref:cytosolic phospholipase A2 beta n=1 Tax=Monodelphis domestica TaxID=13616 RepID=UPI0024E233B9|nr:cytosolic phospholipase A2 beta [Monodelphis domestica]
MALSMPGSSLLSVRILKAHGFPSKDILTQSDSYVSLWLPTASSQEFRTRTVRNCSNPVWNQTFRFRIHSHLKNLLELKMFDQDFMTKDDPVFSVLFDVGTLKAGESHRESFTLNPQGQEQLDVEFCLQSFPACPEQLITNGVLVARELSSLDVKLEKIESTLDNTESDSRVQALMPGSYEGSQTIISGTSPVRFHSPTCWDSELSVKLQDTSQEVLKVPLKSLPSGHAVKVSLPTTKEPALMMQLKTEKCPEEPAVRLGFGLCQEEQAFLKKRKQVVAKALKQVLQLENELPEDEVPVVAIMATGGGIRAMTSLYGQLSGLKELGLLDCVSYITGASGSTWAMANLYEDPDWSQKDLAGPMAAMRAQVTKSKLSILAPSRLQWYRQELKERAKLGHPACFTNLWALLNEALLHDEVPHDYKLSGQQEALEHGQNPMPIYCALNTKEKNLSTFEFGEWVEFSPYEVGFPKYGAFVPAELFGSQFFMGRLMKRLPESRICFLEGIWSNLYAANLQDSLYWSSEPDQFWDRWAQDQVTLEKENTPLLKMEEPPSVTSRIAKFFMDLLTRRPMAGAIHNFLHGLHFHRDYFKHPHFSAWKGTKLDGHPYQLTPAEPYLCLLDVGYFINTSCPPLLTPTREVDLILSLDYNLHGAFQQMELVGRYCQQQGIPFPPIALSPEDRKQPQECHVFSDPESAAAPIVLHFPLVNDSFQQHSAPGVQRKPEELAAGEVNLSTSGSPYHYSKVTYSEENADKLLSLARYNICNNQQRLLQALREALAHRRQRHQRHRQGQE